ncbi:flagellar biosynthesis anti-sigma factor FlgM [Campylobacter jejuni]|uniref:flagellar biosynthesis anti-sigma factor FlgM n=1 Tax=Campylobacter jejuni TaxID=197 RepID=UPI001792E2AA|nr:flagellar biosynthesis anti-sigma factor FlgM [Campylobacter jejuni]MCE3579645.1 flagellar biosynthesis anti-sigma factor FlgM [Campylobacter jejuni]MCH3836881.1 flagellar biosynthesis anti-sigma factor FlgM [Campylobacter jejuni]MCH3843009.1 flagellar biosynthesis anti-sigma factor FlgM [Campylobacter jejuni]MCH3869569.1 flagellar biosynthesis anti-sigma factor FlgM [Campylobacter jejuni]MCH3874232.1 flagellar biosynthesis anti-sigma factor FlgM [Campylobacter jejuni]
MINPIQQSYVANTALNTNRIDKETKTNDTQKTENDKASKIAEQIKNGTYKIDIKATAAAIADSLI